jgi:hypothetical protein
MKLREALGRIAIFDPNVRVEDPQNEDLAEILKYIVCVAVAVVALVGLVMFKTST